MKEKYEYVWLRTDNNLEKVNEWSKEGWKIIQAVFTPGGNLLSVLMERERF